MASEDVVTIKVDTLCRAHTVTKRFRQVRDDVSDSQGADTMPLQYPMSLGRRDGIRS
jgi:hypothetical protein